MPDRTGAQLFGMEAVLEECRAALNLDLHAAGHKSHADFHRFPSVSVSKSSQNPRADRALFSGLVDSETRLVSIFTK